ncbi:MAG: xanthine phosphoribosyltransferase [Blautia sp.]|nr:xanthine phosphoribosyltransferase [Blautia sp.]
MQQLREAIMRYGQGIGDDIVKVDMFLNHRLQTDLVFDMGKEFAQAFREDKPDLVFTLEASGIALAFATAHALGDIPLVFAKKGSNVIQDTGLLTATVFSFTHKTETIIHADRQYLPRGSRVLIIDDFLADGCACNALLDLCRQAGCPVVGIGIAIEKGFLPGSSLLRSQGLKVRSLAVVTGIKDGKLILADD